MTTSVIEVCGMLSVLSSRGVEQQLGKLRGVLSATVNYAVGNVTVRCDEARITITDIRAECITAGTAVPANGIPRVTVTGRP